MVTSAKRLAELSMTPPLAKEVAANIPSANATLQGLVALTAATGTTGTVVSDVTASFSQSVLNNNFKVLADRINAILAALKA